MNKATIAQRVEITSKEIKVKKEQTGEKFIFKSRKECSRELGIPYTTLNNHISNKKPIKGFLLT